MTDSIHIQFIAISNYTFCPKPFTGDKQLILLHARLIVDLFCYPFAFSSLSSLKLNMPAASRLSLAGAAAAKNALGHWVRQLELFLKDHCLSRLVASSRVHCGQSYCSHIYELCGEAWKQISIKNYHS